jgi:glycosyltransferase involved in cell wall biosynthesis
MAKDPAAVEGGAAMKVLHLSTSDIKGGAARATYRLHQGLQQAGVESALLVQEKSSDDPRAIAPQLRLAQCAAASKVAFDALPLKLYPGRDRALFSLQWLPDQTLPKVRQFNPDVINLHWISAGFLNIRTLARLNRPLVWTLHDMWAMTGGCHYSGDCDRYRIGCGNCPHLGSQSSWDLSRWTWLRKANAWKNLNLTLVAPTQWMLNCARSSALFQQTRLEYIPHGLDSSVYRPLDRQSARAVLNLPADRFLILFGAIQATSDRRKGFHLLQSALQSLRQSGADSIEVVVFGSRSSSLDLGFKAHYLGHLHDDISLALLYSAADVMVVPSLQEAFGQTALESMACGTPVVAFRGTGLDDLVDHQQNGYLATPFQATDLAQGIHGIKENSALRIKMGIEARHKVEQAFTLAIQAQRYQKLFTN